MNRTRRELLRMTTILVTSGVIIFFNNCGGGFDSVYTDLNGNLTQSPSPTPTPVLTPTPTLTPTPSPTPCKNYADLRWTAPSHNEDGTPITDLAGFVISYGMSAGANGTDMIVADPSARQHRVTNLSPGTYYFVIKAFNSVGVQSDSSNERSLVLNVCE